jgi:hypothetical protein
MTRTRYPAGHVIHMSLDHDDPAQSISVAHCDCGWESRYPWPGNHTVQDTAIESHWQAVEENNRTLFTLT